MSSNRCLKTLAVISFSFTSSNLDLNQRRVLLSVIAQFAIAAFAIAQFGVFLDGFAQFALRLLNIL